MKKMTIFLISLIMMSTTCIKKDPLLVENNLKDSVYVIVSFKYPDTTLGHIDKANLGLSLINMFPPKSERHTRFYTLPEYSNYKNWKNLSPFDTILLFVLNKDSVDANDWNKYAKGNNFLRKYKFSYEDIIKNEYKIIIE